MKTKSLIYQLIDRELQSYESVIIETEYHVELAVSDIEEMAQRIRARFSAGELTMTRLGLSSEKVQANRPQPKLEFHDSERLDLLSGEFHQALRDGAVLKWGSVLFDLDGIPSVQAYNDRDVAIGSAVRITRDMLRVGLLMVAESEWHYQSAQASSCMFDTDDTRDGIDNQLCDLITQLIIFGRVAYR